MPYPLPERNKKISTLIKWFVERKKGKVVAASFLGKAKTMCMMIGLTLTLFGNVPFAFVNLPISN